MSVTKPLPHDAAKLHVTGTARYVDDIPMPANTLHLAFGCSTIARGSIATIDLAKVKASKGVTAVLVARDLPFTNDVSPSIHDEPMLSDGAIHYLGQPIFLVVADTHLNARAAARLGDIGYAEETPILSIEDALAANARFEDGPRIYTKGDVDTALASAPRRLSGRLEMGGQEHFYLEGQAALALPQEGGDMVVHSSTQHPTEIQHKVAESLGVAMHSVRVEIRRMGGGFGGKESQGNALAVSCAVAARATGRPCKMRYDRDDDMTITGKRHDFRIDYDVGFDDAGRIAGLDFTHYTRCGWAQDLSLPVADRAMLHADNAYLLPAARITSHRLKTNMQSATAFRGFGGPQGMLGIERVMDHVAHALGKDAAEVRRANYYAAAVAQPDASGGSVSGKMMPGTGARFGAKHSPKTSADNTTPYDMDVTDFILHDMTDRLLTDADYAPRKAAIADWNANHASLKKGIAFSPVKFGISFTLTHLNQAGALVHVYADGSIHLNHGGTEMGQGLFQKVAQVAASRFGVGIEAIKITATDTGKVPNTSATAASSGSDLNGMAVQIACDIIRDRIAACLAEVHQVKAEAVAFHDGTVLVAGETISFADAAKTAYENRVSLSATGFYRTPDLAWDRIAGKGRPFFYFAYGAAISEVVIDTNTGENRLLRVDILHDAGASLNPAIDIGQIEGGFVQGAGWLTTEELVWDDKGALRTHAPSTYKIPACSDRPDVFNVALWDGENRADTIYRSKAVGEPPFMLGISAHMALANACSACGSIYPDLQAPATAEEVLQAVKKIPRMTDFVTVTVASTKGSAPREAGASMQVWATYQSGTIGGGALEWDAARIAREMLLDGRYQTRRTVSLGPDLGQCCGGVVTLDFIRDAPADELMGRALWIWGAGHVGRAIAEVIGPLADRPVTLIDTNAARMPDDVPLTVSPLIATDPVRAVQHAPRDADHLILTYSHDIDLALCDALLRHGFASCGLIGSGTKWARFRARLASMGHTDAQITRIACPIGDPSLGKHPQAIAVGVAAALISPVAKSATGERTG